MTMTHAQAAFEILKKATKTTAVITACQQSGHEFEHTKEAWTGVHVYTFNDGSMVKAKGRGRAHKVWVENE